MSYVFTDPETGRDIWVETEDFTEADSVRRRLGGHDMEEAAIIPFRADFNILGETEH